ncbi:unnamed protein product, partial [Hymenolepis diminuta]
MSTANDNGISPKDRNFGFFTLNRRNIFNSNSFLNNGSNAAERRTNFQKSWSQADTLPGSLSNNHKIHAIPKKWNQPSGK